MRQVQAKFDFMEFVRSVANTGLISQFWAVLIGSLFLAIGLALAMERHSAWVAEVAGEVLPRQERALVTLDKVAKKIRLQQGAISEDVRRAVLLRVDDARIDLMAARDGALTALQSTGRLASNAFAAILIATLVLGPIGLISVHRFRRRLRAMTRIMLQVSRNDNSVELPNRYENDEIGDMARAVRVFKGNADALLDHQLQLENLNYRFDIALNNMERGLSMFDSSGRLVVCNRIFQTMYRLPDDLCQPGVLFRDLLAHRLEQGCVLDGGLEHCANKWHDNYTRMVERGTPFKLSFERHDGQRFEISYQPLGDGGCVAVHEDVTAQRKAEAEINKLAREDALTGLANRYCLLERLNGEFDNREQDVGFAIHLLDLDRFKEVNDTLGHPSGDLLLKSVSQRILRCVRRGDFVARLGGDEFAVVQAGASSRVDADHLARRLIETISEPYAIHGQQVQIGASIGVALVPQSGVGAEDILKKADIALYQAKGAGRGQLVHFRPELEHNLRAKCELESAMKEALGRGEITLHYQPIISTQGGQPVACEALMRWHHAEQGPISPGVFIPLAEDCGMITALGEWAIREACKEAANWPEPLQVSVNLSAIQFDTSDLIGVVTGALAQAQLAPSRLILEVTESLLLKEDPRTSEVLHALRNIGVTIALDDFGTGYSSLSYLRAFPFDTIKIDRTFMRDVGGGHEIGQLKGAVSGPGEVPSGSQAVALLASITSLAKTLGMRTVAEGIENDSQLDAARIAGCDHAQGFLFARPMPACELAGELSRLLQKY